MAALWQAAQNSAVFSSGRITAFQWRSRWARISASATGRVIGAPASSTSTAGTPIRYLPGPVVSVETIEWQVEQVTPSSSKGRFLAIPWDRSPERSATGLWQPSQWREYCTPFSSISRLTFFRYQGARKLLECTDSRHW